MDPIVIDSNDSDFEPTTGHCLGLVAADGPVTKVSSEGEDSDFEQDLKEAIRRSLEASRGQSVEVGESSKVSFMSIDKALQYARVLCTLLVHMDIKNECQILNCVGCY